MINESFDYKIRLYYHYEIVLNYKKYSIGNNLPSISHLKNSKEAKKYGFIYSYYIYLSYIEL